MMLTLMMRYIKLSYKLYSTVVDNCRSLKEISVDEIKESLSQPKTDTKNEKTQKLNIKQTIQ